MKLKSYQTLIQQLPVRQQAFTARRNTWENIANKVVDFRPHFDELFLGGATSIQFSRQDIFDTEDAASKILKTIIWGYPRGMRGNHFKSIFQELPALATLLQKHQGQDLRQEIYQAAVLPTFKATPGLGLSTYSKLLYFFEIKIENHPCLILDERLLRSFRTRQFPVFDELANKPKSNPAKWYVDYLRVMDEQARELDTQPDKLEQFLFLFGANLKPG